MAIPMAEFDRDGVHLVGVSLAGEETVIIAPELNIAFDVGRAPRELLGVDHVFLSHGHMDHAAGVAYYCSQRMFLDNAPGNLYAPAPLIDPIRRLLRLWAEIDGNEPPVKLHAARPHEDIVLRKDLLVRPFAVNHTARRGSLEPIHALGFAAIEVRQKLLDEYTQLSGPQLVELKKQGVAITRRVEIPLVTYSGDTAIGPFLELDYVRDSRVLLLECTFYEPDHVERARAGNHMHISDLRKIVPHLRNPHIVLIHATRRTSLADARVRLRRELGADADRITFLMEHRRRRRPPAAPESAG